MVPSWTPTERPEGLFWVKFERSRRSGLRHFGAFVNCSDAPRTSIREIALGPPRGSFASERPSVLN